MGDDGFEIVIAPYKGRKLRGYKGYHKIKLGPCAGKYRGLWPGKIGPVLTKDGELLARNYLNYLHSFKVYNENDFHPDGRPKGKWVKWHLSVKKNKEPVSESDFSSPPVFYYDLLGNRRMNKSEWREFLVCELKKAYRVGDRNVKLFFREVKQKIEEDKKILILCPGEELKTIKRLEDSFKICIESEICDNGYINRISIASVLLCLLFIVN